MPTTPNLKKAFTDKLLIWNALNNKRIMPWKGEKDPYKIWLSEIILQQTRVEQGLTYYEKFLEHFPTIDKLAQAPDEEVYKLWEGLGYYTRCKNLLATARNIVANNKGVFPKSFVEILQLKGVGNYTASAIASFAYGLPHAVVDGNVLRVLSRFFGKQTPIDTTAGKEFYEKLAGELLDVKDTGGYNQAIMDFGATICKPQLPECKVCILKDDCMAYRKGLVNKLPIKEKKLLKKKRWFYYFVFKYNDKILVNKRTDRDIWQNLYEFYLHEAEASENWEQKKIEELLSKVLEINEFKIIDVSKVLIQQLTHQTISGQFILVDITYLPPTLNHLMSVPTEVLSTLAFPKFINQYLEIHSLAINALS